MLKFTLSGRSFLLDESTSVRITSFNPACFFDKIEGDVGMGITIPDNAHNRALLGNPGRFERDSAPGDNEFPGFEVRYSGVLLLAGTLVIQGFAGKAYNGWLRSNVGNMGKQHREKFFYDIAAFDQPISFTNKANYDPETDPYGCPTICNPDFFKDKGRKKPIDTLRPNPDYYEGSGKDAFIEEPIETEVLTIAFRKSALMLVNRTSPGGTIRTDVSTALLSKLDTDLIVYVVSPMLFLNFVVKSILADAKFYIENNAIIENEDLKKLLIYNNFDITNVVYADTTTTIVTQEWTNSQQGVFIPGTVQNISTIARQIARHYNGTFKYKDLLPKTKLKDFLLGIQNLLNVCFHFLPTGKVNIIDREEILTNPAIDINKYMVGDWEISEKKDVTLKFKFTHDDNDVFFAESWEDVDDRREDEKEPVETWDELMQIVDPQIGEMRYIKSVNVYAQYTWLQQKEYDPSKGSEIMTDAIGWEWIASGFQNGFFNTKKEQVEEIETVFSTISGDQTVMTYQKGNIQSMKMAYESFSPRLLFYKGNNTGGYKTDTLALDWEQQEIGLLAKRWPKWARFWSQRKPVSREADLPLNVLDYITRNITNKFRTDNGEFIIETLQTEFRLNSFGPTEIAGYKNGYVPNTYDLDQHWAPGNLILMDELIDFTGFDNMNFNL